jgi:hypothetical protein
VLIADKIYNYKTVKSDNKLDEKSIAIVVPCYNENETLEELCGTFNSIFEQKNIDSYKKLLIVICDGSVLNPESVDTTDNLLIKYIFLNKIYITYLIRKAYKTWDGYWQNLHIHVGNKEGMDFMLIIKEKNYGKRYSLTLIRRLCANYINYKKNDLNAQFESLGKISFDLVDIINNKFKKIFGSNIDFIYGTDADTILEENCISKLIESF